MSEEPITPQPDWKSKLRETFQNHWSRVSTKWNESELPAKIQTKFLIPLKERFVQALPQDLARSLPRTFDPAAMAEWTGQALQRQGAAFYGKLATLLLCTYFLADLSALYLSGLVPNPPLSRGGARSYNPDRRSRTADDYAVIWARNLFNSQGRIPGEENPTDPNADPGGTPVRTTLPFTLVGTMILEDELRSIATIEDKSASTVYPVRMQDEIPSKARIIKIEPRKVIFLNTSSGRREFIDLPEDLATSNPRITIGKPRGGIGNTAGAGIEKVAPNQFNVARGEVDKALQDLNQVLTQARAVPNFENGMPAGYKLFQIVPGSIYDKLGLQNGDVIQGFDGENVNDPGKAFEKLGSLKTTNHLELTIKRDGRTQNFAYDIR
jgi:general secretion pathway protein C